MLNPYVPGGSNRKNKSGKGPQPVGAGQPLPPQQVDVPAYHSNPVQPFYYATASKPTPAAAAADAPPSNDNWTRPVEREYDFPLRDLGETSPVRGPAPLLDQVAPLRPRRPEASFTAAARPLMSVPAPEVAPPSSFAPAVASAAHEGIDLGGFDFTEDRLNNLLNASSAYMYNARREGLERAAERGGLNSSIAAGLSTREAIRAAAPIAQADAGFTQERFLTNRRAQLEDTLAGNQMNRTMVRDSLLADLDSRRMNQEADLMGQRDVRLSRLRQQEVAFEADIVEQARDNDAQRDVWRNTQSNLSRAYTESLLLGQQANLDFLSSLGRAFIDDPEVYSPDVVSGMNNFFTALTSGAVNTNLNTIIRDIIGTGSTLPVRPPVAPPVGG